LNATIRPSGRIGPNALLQLVPVLEQAGGADLRDAVFADGGVFQIPAADAMIEEGPVAAAQCLMHRRRAEACPRRGDPDRRLHSGEPHSEAGAMPAAPFAAASFRAIAREGDSKELLDVCRVGDIPRGVDPTDGLRDCRQSRGPR